MSEIRPIVGDWRGTIYDMMGNRTDWWLSLWSNGNYAWKTYSSRAPEGQRIENGKWELTENGNVLSLAPETGESTRWTIHDVTGCEGASTLLVLRRLALASRNLPILLYRVHPLGIQMPLDARGFPDS